MKAGDILKRGFVEVHAKVGGIRQLHVLKVTYEKTVWGMVPYLVSRYKLPTVELLRLAEELQLPIKCHGVTAFPKGKAPQDFARKEEEPKAEEEKKEKEEDSEKNESGAKGAADPKPEKKIRRKMLSHDAIVKDKGAEGEEGNQEGPAQEGTKEAGAAAEEGSEPAEEATTSKENKESETASVEPEDDGLGLAPALAVITAASAEPREQAIELEPALQPEAKKDAQEQKETVPKDKKRLFDDSVLSEGIQR